MERRTASVTHSMSQTRTSRVDPYRDDVRDQTIFKMDYNKSTVDLLDMTNDR